MTEKNKAFALLDPETLSAIGQLDILARQVVEGYFAGMHRSPFKGFSVEFAEHRSYQKGDDIRYIDWKLWAKRDRYHIKEFEAETCLSAILAFDASNSMGFKGLSKISKLQYAVQLSAALAYLLIRQRDAVGLAVMDTAVRTLMPPRSTTRHLHHLLVELTRIRPAMCTDLGKSLMSLGERLTRRGLLILISDLWDELSSIISGLRAFREKKHEVIVFHLLDPLEMDISLNRPVIIEDMEGGGKLPWTPRQREAYRRNLEQRLDTLDKTLGEMGADYVVLTTDQHHGKSLAAYLAKRKRLW